MFRRTFHQPVLVVILAFLAVSTAPVLATDADVAAFFGGDCEEITLREIRKARKRIRIAAYSLTSNYVVDALIEARKRGVDVVMKIDLAQSEEDSARRLINRLRNGRISVKTIGMPAHYSMHNKFLIIDGKTVITGSYNFTIAAARANWENIVRIRSSEIADDFAREWDALRTRRKVNGRRMKSSKKK
jgi:phosphatidylserine/phosphatidylglycerophosphate/cardiolipin synthase-like enzyme